MSTIAFAPDSPFDLDENFTVETLEGGGVEVTASPFGNDPFGIGINYVNITQFDDKYNGADIRDVVDGGEGNDTLDGAGGNDNLQGGAGDDLVDGGTGEDVLTGGIGFDTLLGGEGNDNLDGGKGNDELEGGEGEDVIQGGEGKDTLIGGEGNDTIIAGAGDDVLAGGAGADSFVLQVTEETGGDIIQDFEAGGDKIRILGAVGGNVVYDSNTGELSVNGEKLVQLDPGLDFGSDDFELF